MKFSFFTQTLLSRIQTITQFQTSIKDLIENIQKHIATEKQIVELKVDFAYNEYRGR